MANDGGNYPSHWWGGLRLSPALHMWLDQGSIGWPGVGWALHDLGLRGSRSFDRFHRIINDWNGAVTAAGLMMSKVEYQVVLLMRIGPFGGGANHSVLLNCAADMFRYSSSMNPVFLHLYEAICSEMSWSSDPEFGTLPHMQQVWARLKHRLTGAKQREKMKMSRWWSWEIRARVLCREIGVSVLLLLLTYVGWKKKWWASWADCVLVHWRS